MKTTQILNNGEVINYFKTIFINDILYYIIYTILYIVMFILQ